MKISVDFDDTLSICSSVPGYMWGSGGTYLNGKLAKLLDQLKDEHEIVILTARPNNKENLSEIEIFLRVHNLEYIKEIHFTNYDFKGKYAKELGVELHFDDQEAQIKSIREHGIKCVPIVDGQFEYVQEN